MNLQYQHGTRMLCSFNKHITSLDDYVWFQSPSLVSSVPSAFPRFTGASARRNTFSKNGSSTHQLEYAAIAFKLYSKSRRDFSLVVQVVDSRARNLADGSVQQKQQTKQLEVFQAQIPGGSVQVIRSHTSTTSSWHNSKVISSSLGQCAGIIIIISTGITETAGPSARSTQSTHAGVHCGRWNFVCAVPTILAVQFNWTIAASC